MKTPIHPAWVMLLFWCFIFQIYIFGPITLTPEISFLGFFFIVAHIALFATSSTLIPTSAYKQLPGQKTPTNFKLRQDAQNIICMFLLIGIAGGLLSILSKLNVLEGFNLQSIAKLRTLRAQSLLHGGEAQSGVASILAFLTYPAGFVGLVAGILHYETTGRFTRLALYLYVFIIFFVAIVAGGRSPILLLLLFLAIACYTRTILGRSCIPKSRPLRIGAILLLVVFIVYSSIVWTVRSTESGQNNTQFFKHAANVWGAKPKPYLLEASTRLNTPSLTKNVLSSVFYLTQSLSVTERILTNPEDIPTLFGAYHVDLFAAGLRDLPEGGEFLEDKYRVLLDANVYGYFTGAWGALFIDFGYFSFFVAALWGALAGLSWRNLKNRPSLHAAVMYVFWIYSIFISFVSPPFGFSNSFMVFIWFFLFSFLNRLSEKYAITSGITLQSTSTVSI